MSCYWWNALLQGSVGRHFPRPRLVPKPLQLAGRPAGTPRLIPVPCTEGEGPPDTSRGSGNLPAHLWATLPTARTECGACSRGAGCQSKLDTSSICAKAGLRDWHGAGGSQRPACCAAASLVVRTQAGGSTGRRAFNTVCPSQKDGPKSALRQSSAAQARWAGGTRREGGRVAVAVPTALGGALRPGWLL